MQRTILGAVLALLLASAGLFWWQGRAEVEANAPPPPALAPAPPDDALPLADPGDMTGPTPPEVSKRTREQLRFDRYDRNRDNIISRNELLAVRTDAFRKLDKDGNNLLTFEEWAVATVDKFEGADTDKDGKLTRAEFATTAPKPVAKKPACKC
ncbi:MAG: EF-hand domain-containing protein [Erythrobacter sp.]|jgi:hypothetical protein